MRTKKCSELLKVALALALPVGIAAVGVHIAHAEQSAQKQAAPIFPAATTGKKSIEKKTAVHAPHKGDDNSPVHISAQELSHDNAAQTVTALGDVEVEQGGRILHADKVIYALKTDTVSAIGNVSLLDERGDVHFMDRAQLTGGLKNGYIKGLLSILADGSRFSAMEVRRKDGVMIMTNASYTACKVCETDPHPLWQIKADQVIHDEEKKTVDYKNARLEMFGIPVAWSPIFSHADPSVKRKSGFLRPRYGYSSDVGAFAEGGYYFGDIAPDIDAMLEVRPTQLEGTLVQGDWRERFENGKIEIQASGVQSDRKKEDGTVELNRNRGHIFANGLFDINDDWRTGFNIQRTTDKQYLRLYDISTDNVLESNAYAERFSGRDYSLISATNFQDVRLGVRAAQPNILPQLEHHMIGAPDSFLGGRWSADFSMLGLLRTGSGQDMQRESVNLGWQRRDIAQNGLVFLTRLSGREDYYTVHDSDAAAANPALPRDASDARSMGVADVTVSYPVVKRLNASQIVLEPVMGASISPQINQSDSNIPNEDSIDVQIDTDNLFALTRFPGIDLQEDGARFNYGLKAGLYGDDGRYGKVYFGQSYRFNNDAVFPAGSGFTGNASDYVGEIGVGLAKNFDLDYRFQLDSSNLSFNRQEILANGGNDTFNLNVGYIYLATVEGTGFDETRQQAQVGGTYKLSHNWSVSSSVLQDIGEEPGLRRASIGLDYADECFTFGLEGARNLVTDASGESGTVVLLRIGFKNIGQFSTPSIQLKGNKPIDQTP